MRRKWVYDPETRGMGEVTQGRRETSDAPMVWGDLKPFVSPATGEYISDRGQLRRHLKQNGIAPADEVRGTAEKVRAERERNEARSRKQAVIDAYEHRRNEMRAKDRFG